MLKCEHFIDSIYYQLEQTAKYCRYLGMQLFQKLNLPINLDEFVVLDTLLGHEGICQRDLAKLILKDRPSTGRLLNSLEEKGYITRTNDTKNNRLVRRLRVTKSGKKLYETQFSIMEKVMDKLLEKFSEEKMIDLRDTLVQLEQALSEIVEFNI